MDCNNQHIMSTNESVVNAFNLSDQIISRLFNHKPFIFGEIRFIIKEFEDKRQDRDRTALNESLQRLMDITDKDIDSAIDCCQQLDNNLNSRTHSLDQLMQEILDLESKQESHRKEVLSANRVDRNVDLMSLIETYNSKINDIDGQFDEQEKQLTLEYKLLETKLNIIPNNCNESSNVCQNIN
ncbi:biogenesis of lysosome-related organelles complex 1 subunit 5-like [Oppia nitens]|uniref:biogenesis of lysosome-related organelles complex 1 subunit 5-like n=1 Tax=Oppia nitens TaxID=1686743 RepID=UPI0023DA8985|nr:biogenesis of lysosome-related organelles complex 1 subunit 5-like [Oppia nitens]